MSQDSKLILEIKGTFEIAIARNRLRQLTSKYRFPLMLQARAAAALTCVAEMILFHSDTKNRQLHLSIIVHDEAESQEIEFQFLAPLSSEISAEVGVAQWQLENACDELKISNRGVNDFVTMRLWVRRKS